MKINRILKYIIFAIILFWVLLPFYTAIIISVSPWGELPTSLGLPSRITLTYWAEILTENATWVSLSNSLIVASMVSSVTILITYPAAFTFSRYRLKGLNFAFISLLFFRMVPAVSLAIPLFIFWNELGLLGTLHGLALSQLIYTIPLCTWLMKGFFDMVPIGLDESAKMDGASDFHIFTKIVLPLSKPALITTFTFAFLLSYIELMFCLLIGAPNLTIAAKLSQYVQPHITYWREMCVTALISALPMILIFGYLQKRMARIFTFGVVK